MNMPSAILGVVCSKRKACCLPEREGMVVASKEEQCWPGRDEMAVAKKGGHGDDQGGGDVEHREEGVVVVVWKGEVVIHRSKQMRAQRSQIC